MLNKRCVDIIKKFSENKTDVLLKDLAEYFGVSERSIRYDIDNINYFLAKKGLNQIEKVAKGYFEIDESDENLSEAVAYLKDHCNIIFPAKK